MSPAPFARLATAITAALTMTLALGAAIATFAQDMPAGYRVTSSATGRDDNVINYNANTNYILRCAGCHGTTGMGTANAGVPPFPDSVGHIAGLESGRSYMLHVPGVVSSSLSDTQIADVLNYILERWSGMPFTPFTTEEVIDRRQADVPDIVVARRAIVENLNSQGITIAAYPWP